MDRQPDRSEAALRDPSGPIFDLPSPLETPNLPVLAPQQLPVPTRRAQVANDKLTLNFVHPTNPSETLTATVTPTSTPQYLIGQLVKAGFIAAPEQAGQYKLRDVATGKQLLDQTTLADAGVLDGANLQVDHPVTGAWSAACFRKSL